MTTPETASTYTPSNEGPREIRTGEPRRPLPSIGEALRTIEENAANGMLTFWDKDGYKTTHNEKGANDYEAVVMVIGYRKRVMV